MGFYKDHYEVIIIGGGLAGMAACLQLQQKGVKDILILEKHNMPGGLATDYVRDGFEIEATLHEMMSIGPKDHRLKVGEFFDQCGVDIDWLPVPECYRVVCNKDTGSSDEDIDVTLHDGYETMAHEVDAAVPGTYDKVLSLMHLCRRVYDSMNILSVTPMSKPAMLLHHPDFVKTLGYSATEVINTFDLPKKAVDILTPYWIYVGHPMDDLPFTIYAFLMADYFTGSYVCRGFSHEMSMKMQRKCEENGAQYELKQEVEKILVRDGADGKPEVYGVRTRRGDEIHSDYVISGAYPNKVYSQMIEPLDKVPVGAIREVNARHLSVVPVSTMLILRGRPEELGIRNYSTFSGSTMDTNQIWKNYAQMKEPYDYITTICLNYANPDCVPDGYTQLSITSLVSVEPFEHITESEYYDLKRRLAKNQIRNCMKVTKVNLFDKIEEIEVSTPITISHYVGAWKGAIYGYSHSMDDHVVARLTMSDQEDFIHGLAFAGAFGISGDGMGPAVTNGRAAAKYVLEDLKRQGKQA